MNAGVGKQKRRSGKDSRFLDELLFRVQSLLDYSVTLWRQNWERHLARHPELVGHLDDVAHCIEKAHIVITRDGGDHYYGLGYGSGRLRECYLHVLIRDFGQSEADHRVVSAWFTRQLEKGEIRWFKML